jgi:thioredoxin reductase
VIQYDYGSCAAGDVTNGSNNFRQAITSAAEGTIAADAVFNALKE